MEDSHLRGSSRWWFAGVDKTKGRNLALHAEIIYSLLTSAVVALAFFIFLCSVHFADFPVSRDWPDLRSSKTPRHFDEAIKNFLDSLMSHQTLTARHIQLLFSTWTSPLSFSPARRASELPLRSGLARGLPEIPRESLGERSRKRDWGKLPPRLNTIAA